MAVQWTSEHAALDVKLSFAQSAHAHHTLERLGDIHRVFVKNAWRYLQGLCEELLEIFTGSL